jgi:hypothetical protein
LLLLWGVGVGVVCRGVFGQNPTPTTPNPNFFLIFF